MNKFLGLITIVLLASPLISTAQKFENLALTPPMGWNSWGHFGCEINEIVVRDITDAIVASGLKDAGYEYIVIDDCWQVGRDSAGNIIPDPEKFPSGMKALADHVHSRGLKFGLYSCAGVKTCQGRPGSRGYEFHDARQYAAWGVDFVKYDWCNVSTQDAEASYTLMRDAIYAAGRPVVFSLCEWGLSKPWLWAENVGHMWRTTGDLRDNWSIPDAKGGYTWGGGVLINLSMQKELENFAGPDHWNDPDYLVVGNGGLNEAESRAHFSMWCMLAAPLFATNDLRNMDPSTQEILTNKEAIAVDQDPLGKQGSMIREIDRKVEIWKKELSDGYAFCILNKDDKPRNLAFTWKEFGIDDTGLEATNIWDNTTEVIQPEKSMQYGIESHDVVFLRIK